MIIINYLMIIFQPNYKYFVFENKKNTYLINKNK